VFEGIFAVHFSKHMTALLLKPFGIDQTTPQNHQPAPQAASSVCRTAAAAQLEPPAADCALMWE
jgi:hypothetical protein